MSEGAWNAALHPAHCGNCHAAFLLPANAGAPWCPNCFAARLEPIPALALNAAPELILPFNVADATLQANLERWARDIPFKASNLNGRDLRAKLTPVFVPMYLADRSVWGTWSAQMGFDYLVASSEERYNGSGWVSQRLNETRIRWEPRLGEIAREYENLPAPALEGHAQLMFHLGDAKALPFDTSRAVPFADEMLQNALVRMPEIEPDAAWNVAVHELERRAGNDCQIAANAQHHEKFSWHVLFGTPHWTLLLLPMYVTSYTGDDNKAIPVRVNGQTGLVSGVRRASMKNARRWTLLLGGIAALAFLLGVIVVVVSFITPEVQAAAGVLLVLTLVLCLAAPVPLIVVWQYNRVHDGE